MTGMRIWMRRGLLALAAMILAMPAFQAGAGVDLPKLEKGKGEKCVEETQLMRRNHMEFLKHHRDETMRKGIRTTKHSLKKCVECHASEKTGSVASAKSDFCVACHSYASVKLDCWDCHATKPRPHKAALAASGAEAASPMLAQAKEAAK